ncbi:MULTISPECIES: metal-sensitive transcriptional regulator [Desulfosporosinus]|uniref:Copper-sensing transcriptional repressor CsoR n=1 Tax=Desulfosporosinus acididurans TaxID=476652 RepID=A0A0J1IND6_9FIRM|nr:MULTISPECIES: metal-sensitive transcriptional regulator [Desulfosporosinus]KLU66196.1 copper-sensing transcriptional repressor CsoR [Desulfosporosinus acididurans]
MKDVDQTDTKKIITRLKTVRGHISGVERMIEEDKPCEDILLQLVAIRSAVQKVSVIVAQHYANSCLVEALDKGENRQEVLSKAIETLMKLNQ